MGRGHNSPTSQTMDIPVFLCSASGHAALQTAYAKYAQQRTGPLRGNEQLRVGNKTPTRSFHPTVTRHTALSRALLPSRVSQRLPHRPGEVDADGIARSDQVRSTSITDLRGCA